MIALVDRLMLPSAVAGHVPVVRDHPVVAVQRDRRARASTGRPTPALVPAIDPVDPRQRGDRPGPARRHRVVVGHHADRVDERRDRRVVVDPVAAVVGLAGVVHRRDADGQRAAVGVQPLGQLARRTPPSSAASPPTCRGRRRTRTARSRCRCRRSRRRRRTSRGRRRGAARCAGSARMPAITPASVPSRIDGDERDARVAGRVEELLGLVGRRVGLDLDRVDAGRPEPERRQLVDRVGAGVEVGQRRRRAPSTAPTRGRRAAPGWRGGGASSPPPSDRRRRSPTSDDDGEHGGAADEQPRRRRAASPRAGRSRRPRPVRRRRRRRGDVGAEVAGVTSLQAVDDDAARRRLDRRRCWGRRRTTQPAAVADAHAGRRVLDRHALGRGRRRARAAASRYGSGCGLPSRTSSPVTTAWNVIGASSSTIGVDEPPPRHRHQRARHAEGVELGAAAGGRPAATARARGPGR